MRFDPEHLETLRVIAEEGTFEAAARRLRVTPSAVSQRIRALERTAGQVLVRRTTPAEVTEAGAPLLRLARQLHLLDAEAGTLLPTAPGAEPVVTELAVAVNADSLATWFRPVLDEIAARPATALRLHVEDQAYSSDLLRRGDVQAAITASSDPVQGCSVEHLGTLRYRPAAAPGLLERHRSGRGVDWAAMPVVVFNEKDRLQDDALAARGHARPPVVHRVPSSADFLEAVRRGLGWGMVPEPQLTAVEADGELVRLPGTTWSGVPLHWQRWRLESAGLDDLTNAVRRAARAALARR
ncbi:LysR family transcriptional regulator ArgP [Nocardioides massiliensis]|uniref:LysR family transcriptional regulator (Chromosome initiation inhibitor) n=1 Tax=Nocardioides massiliensis TaxID=1325935 RepID=A0ABT9NUK6_9ACTN|nr:LysR family transcriptional regulator ArgP [Nocardioides massiliensis]MDP9824113.1 LysR family transcriptional regulator (chromosome initiation inhibitor) [Nocardioides massiliensis]